MNEIPFLSVPQLTYANDYMPFRNCINYITQKSSLIPYNGSKYQKERIALMEKVGMKNYPKFVRCWKDGNNLCIPVPLTYLNAIGVDLEVLKYCAGFDYQAYEQALTFEQKVEYFGLRAMACVYVSSKVPVAFQDEKP